MFMAGLCFRGAQCPFSHGTGLQSADDVAAGGAPVEPVLGGHLQLHRPLAGRLRLLQGARAHGAHTGPAAGGADRGLRGLLLSVDGRQRADRGAVSTQLRQEFK